MTVSTQITQRTYSGNGVNCQWTVDFPLADVQDLHVFITSPLGVQEEVFNFSLNADATCVEYPTAQSELDPLAEGWTISLVRKTPLTQQIDLTRHGELDAEVLEQGYDKLTLLAQEMKAQITQQATDLSTQQQALGTEVSNRQEACTTLQSNLSAETAARTQADQALQTALSGEIASRQQEDLSFERALNDEIADRTSAVEALQTQIDAKQEAGDYATNTALTSGLAGKQDTLTTSQLAAVDSGITSSTVSLIPTALQPNDNISSLTNDAHYVTTTDYATTDTGGVVKVSNNGGTAMNASGVITTYRASDDDIDGKTNAYRVIVPRNLDYAVKMGITDNANTLTDAEKAAAQDWLGGLTASKIALMAPYIQKYEVGNCNTQEVVDATDLLAATGDLHALDLDLSKNTQLKKLTASGTSGNLANVSAALVSKEAPLDSTTSPQIDVSYGALNKSALVNLFNSMPYNVGYEVVGNPTITDGVVSGFSGTDALLLTHNLDIKNGLEAVFKIHTASTLPGANQYIMVYNPGNNTVAQPLGLWLGTSGKVAFSTRNGSIVSASALNNDTDYYLKVTSSSGVYELFYGTDGVNYTSIGTATDTDAALTNHIELGAWTFASSSLYRPLKGSIDLNESYIKLSGNMWFRGTEAMTKTCKVVGCAGTADLTQTDKDIALDKGWSLTVA